MERLLGIPRGEGFSSHLGLLGSSGLGFFCERVSGLLVGEVFFVFALCFVGFGFRWWPPRLLGLIFGSFLH